MCARVARIECKIWAKLHRGQNVWHVWIIQWCWEFPLKMAIEHFQAHFSFRPICNNSIYEKCIFPTIFHSIARPVTTLHMLFITHSAITFIVLYIPLEWCTWILKHIEYNTRHRCTIYIIDERENIKLFEMGEWMREIVIKRWREERRSCNQW